MQLALNTSNTSPSVKQLQQSTDDKHLDLLKQTVASLGSIDGPDTAVVNQIQNAAADQA